MIRPCTLPAHWKQTEPFDAMKIRTFLCRPVPYHTQTKKKTEYRIELFINDSDSIFSPATTDHKELERYKFEAITTIAEALNAPVEAKKEVLAGLEYKEVIGYCDAGLQHSGVVGNFAGTWKLNRGSAEYTKSKPKKTTPKQPSTSVSSRLTACGLRRVGND